MTTPRKLSSRLTNDDIVEIKQLLWSGYTQSEVCRNFKVTQPTIHRICQGWTHEEIPWPDGSVGPINRQHYLTERERRKSLEWEDANKAAIETLGEVGNEVPRAHGVQGGPMPNQPTSPRTEVQKQLDAAGAEIADQMEGDLAMTLTDAGETGKRKKRKKPAKVEHEKMEWDDILKEIKRIRRKPTPLILQGETDAKTQEAICIVFKQIPSSMWLEDRAIKLVDQIKVAIDD